MGADTRARALAKIAERARGAADTRTFLAEVSAVVASAVPDVSESIWKTLDPDTLLGTSSFTGRGEPTPAEIFVWDYLGDDYLRTIDAIRTPQGQLTLDDATHGELERCSKYRDLLRPNGIRHVVETIFRDGSCRAWGSFTLVRGVDRPAFDREELQFLRDLAPHLARGVRRAMLVGEAGDPEHPDAPAMVVIGRSLDVESWTPGAQRWLDDLPDGAGRTGSLPNAVLAVACTVLTGDPSREVPGHLTRESGDPAGRTVTLRVVSRSGRWLMLHGAPLDGSASGRAAVVIEPAHPSRVLPLLMDVYGLTTREQEVTRLVLRGDSTARIASQLQMSPHTVQEHLKHIFAKTDVRTRRELTGTVFLDCYAPRVADNARRAATARPLRGGPLLARVP